MNPTASASVSIEPTGVRGVSLYRLPQVQDERGMLTFAEVRSHMPFAVERFFMVYRVPSREVRGEHAHKVLHQFLVCVSGSCSVIADDGAAGREFLLNSPALGLYLPPMTWCVHHKYSPDAVLLVLASDVYESADYIRDYAVFMDLVRTRV
jgi:UDP-2-acetamido-3-amino-2,3-dideoxy-glucuronate N-acetyltransferase